MTTAYDHAARASHMLETREATGPEQHWEKFSTMAAVLAALEHVRKARELLP